MKINIAPQLKDQFPKANQKPLGSSPARGQFLAMIGKSMQSKSRQPFLTDSQNSPNCQTPKGMDYPACLEALRSGLLAKGKPFDRVYLKREDLALVQNMLTQFGYTPAKTDQCLQNLLTSCRDGDLKLSQLFAQLEKLGPPKEKLGAPLVLTASTVPYLESILHEFQLNPNEIRKVLNSDRTIDGGLDFSKVVQTLEKVSHRGSRRFSGIVDLDKSQTVIQDLQRLGIQVPTAKKTGILHIEDFITALKRMSNILTSAAQHAKATKSIEITPEVLKNLSIPMPQTGGRDPVAPLKNTMVTHSSKGSGAGKATPSGVQAAINQVLEHVVVDGSKNDSLTSILTDSKIKFDDPVAKQLHADRMPAKHARLNAQVVNNPQSGLNGETQNFAVTDHANTPRPVVDSGIQVPMQEMAEPELLHPKTKLKSIDLQPEGIDQKRFETLLTTSQKSQQPATRLPNYLVDQLGRQISRAINRGDGIIRFQLKPPELGFIKLEMQLSDNQLNLSVAAENNSVKEILLTNMHELREALMGQGIKIDKLDVHINENFNQSLANFQEGTGKEKGSQNGTNSGESILSADDTPESFFHDRASPRSDVTIDLVA